ncbi:MAG: DUF7448 domain-containing protein [Planctomycetota bacterium]|jgi:hypothetical protein
MTDVVDWDRGAQDCLQRSFLEVALEDNVLLFTFDNGVLRVFDDAQACCENRYMVTDDDLAFFAGSTLIDLTVEDGPDIETEHEDAHEQEFLHVKTSKGSFTMSNHNEHNGYYGGFRVYAMFVPAE